MSMLERCGIKYEPGTSRDGFLYIPMDAENGASLASVNVFFDLALLRLKNAYPQYMDSTDLRNLLKTDLVNKNLTANDFVK